jgi:hypothetical protein
VIVPAIAAAQTAPPASRPSTWPAENNAELTELFEQDQAPRSHGLPSADEMDRLRGFDRMRRLRVLRLLDDGAARTPADLYHAALVLQHGDDPLDQKLAHDLCVRAVEMDGSFKEARWLAAAAWDRYLTSIGKPQWYGTQFQVVGGKYYRVTADLSRVTDADRRAAGTRTIEEIKAFLMKQNGTPDASFEPPPAPDGRSIWTPNMPVPRPPPTSAPSTAP